MRPFREELKFIIDHAQKDAVLERWRRHLHRDPFTNDYAATPILSQYYDSPMLDFYEEKLSGIQFRNKVRLRCYGYRFEPGATAFLEIKQRLGDHVRKIRQKFSFEPARLEPSSWRFDSAEHASAFGVLLERYRLVPSAQVWYQREAYESVVESDIRVTFDSCLMALHPGVQLTPAMLADPTTKLISESFFILEVKSTNGIPRWVTDGARAVEMVQRPVPNYVMAVEALGLDARPRTEATLGIRKVSLPAL